jgi:predicted MFS family arabinose efflux permease
MSDAFTKIYGYDQIKISLLFIPIGGGSICSAFTSAKLVDWNFRRHAAILGVPVIKNRRQDLSNFPIEKARLQIAFPMFFLAGIFLIVFGWLIEKHVMVAGPIVALFFAGYGLTCTFQILNVLMVDIYPGKPSVATAANNLIRCEIGAVFSAIVLPIADVVELDFHEFCAGFADYYEEGAEVEEGEEREGGQGEGGEG